MAAFTKFDAFGEALAKKEHNLHSDTLKVYLTNATPDVAADAVKADLAEISTGNGYTGPVDAQNSVSRSGDVTSILGTDIVITASGGDIGPFRYAVLYNDDHASDGLIGYWDYGSALTLHDGEPLTLDFVTSIFTIVT